MKGLVTVFLICINGFQLTSQSFDLEVVRQQYSQSVTDKTVCQNMITELSKKTETDVHLAYLGAYQTIWANHIFNPISKLATFKKGKANIEKAVQQASENVEIRFIRLSVQQNCPKFLGYYQNISEDRDYLIRYKNTVTSVILQKQIKTLLNKLE
ncbi:hypothetical protein [Flavobacterium agrisoli]|uniref:Uncharacterized protein n=1 Tax=Flavobacterium agrisoli TaxID=2793066 RepID=A0A934UJR2_9FLAO|nr:hypothetical protein [Flavobacterium agrisoli]MBK0370157.1 hypothetical protein [Flavobacterium agrisoli]